MHYNHDLKYTIESFEENNGIIVVVCDKTKQKFSIELPIENGKYPEGKLLDEYIRGFLPTWVTERAEKLQKGVSNTDYFKNLVSKNTQDGQETYKPNNMDEVRRRRNTFLRMTDWIFLPDSPIKDEEYLEKYKKYRQSLRDITKQDLETMVWPKLPDEEKENVV